MLDTGGVGPLLLVIPNRWEVAVACCVLWAGWGFGGVIGAGDVVGGAAMAKPRPSRVSVSSLLAGVSTCLLDWKVSDGRRAIGGWPAFISAPRVMRVGVYKAAWWPGSV